MPSLQLPSTRSRPSLPSVHSRPSGDVNPPARWPLATSSFPCHEYHGKPLVSGRYCAGGHLAVPIRQSLRGTEPL